MKYRDKNIAMKIMCTGGAREEGGGGANMSLPSITAAFTNTIKLLGGVCIRSGGGEAREGGGEDEEEEKMEKGREGNLFSRNDSIKDSSPPDKSYEIRSILKALESRWLM